VSQWSLVARLVRLRSSVLNLKNLFLGSAEVDVVFRVILKHACLIEVDQQQFNSLAPNDPLLEKFIRFEVRVSAVEAPSNLSAYIGNLNTDGLFGINKVHVIPQQIAEVGDPRLMAIFTVIGMVA
jgi:hypothetical protein